MFLEWQSAVHHISRPVDWRSRMFVDPDFFGGDPWLFRWQDAEDAHRRELPPYSWEVAVASARALARLPPLDLAELEGRLLARQSLRSVAARYGVSTRAIRAFKALFFDIDGRTEENLLLFAVPGRTSSSSESPLLHHGSLGDDPCVQVRFFALMGGVMVMERVLEVLRDPDRVFDLTTLEGVRAAKSWFKVKVTLAIRSLEYGDEQIVTKRSLFDRLLRQASATPPARAIWTPLRHVVNRLAAPNQDTSDTPSVSAAKLRILFSTLGCKDAVAPETRRSKRPRNTVRRRRCGDGVAAEVTLS